MPTFLSRYVASAMTRYDKLSCAACFGHGANNSAAEATHSPGFLDTARIVLRRGAMRSSEPCTTVLIVSRNEETARNLRSYFESRNLKVMVATKLADAPGDLRPTALVMFPDELARGEAENELQAFAQQCPSATMTVVTADMQRFEALGARLGDDAMRRLLILPRPAFGWTILDHVITPVAAEDLARGF